MNVIKQINKNVLSRILLSTYVASQVGLESVVKIMIGTTKCISIAYSEAILKRRYVVL